MWMGEQISQRGIGNGISLIIFAGIVARMPNAFASILRAVREDALNPVFVIIVLAMFVVVVALVVYEQQGTAEDSGSLRQEGCWKKDVRCSEHIHSLQDKSFWRYSRNIRVIHTYIFTSDK